MPLKKEMLTAKETERSHTLEDGKYVVITRRCYVTLEKIKFPLIREDVGRDGDFYNNLIVG